jgi:phenylacetate-CoA ligase
LRSVVTWGDKLYEHYRSTIEDVFRSPVHDTYGCGEGIQVAAQCGFGSHYHIHSTEVILECVDGQGAGVAPEEAGNLVLTRLHPGPTPLIRYSVGDVGVRGNRQECACGRQWEILESIEGRISDVVVTPKGNRLIVHFFTGILEHFTGIDCYQVVQKDRRNLEVRIVPAAGADPGDLGRSVKAALEQRGLRDMEISVQAVEEIPVPSSGKRRFVISEVPARLEGSGSRVTGATGRK